MSLVLFIVWLVVPQLVHNVRLDMVLLLVYVGLVLRSSIVVQLVVRLAHLLAVSLHVRNAPMDII